MKKVIEEGFEDGLILGGTGFGLPTILAGVDSIVGIGEILLVLTVSKAGILGGAYGLSQNRG